MRDHRADAAHLHAKELLREAQRHAIRRELDQRGMAAGIRQRRTALEQAEERVIAEMLCSEPELRQIRLSTRRFTQLCKRRF
jgi:hypothetical protein